MQKYYLLLLILLALQSNQLFAQCDCIFDSANGTGNNEWGNRKKWICGGTTPAAAPNSSYEGNICIASDINIKNIFTLGENDPIPGNGTNTLTITIQENVTVTFQNGGALDIQDADGKIIFENNAKIVSNDSGGGTTKLISIGGKDLWGSCTGCNSDDLIGPGELNKDFTPGGTTLPVDLIFFSAKKRSDSILLTWATASEENNDYFEIQKSIDGKNYHAIGIVDGQGNSQSRTDYQFEDQGLVQGVIYYRLKQIDYSGQLEYFTLAFNNNLGENNIRLVSSNPINNNQIKLKVKCSEMQETRIQVIDINSHLYYLAKINLSMGTTLVAITFQQLPPGIFILKVTSPSPTISL
ncbi:hypothetical protein V6R21_24235 [Limibacter armeniacum]|uniref:hypothetical protein n=1 Tax=Limibacter armeniacum TaxID=466084 RepID=UPI002FE66F41